MICKLNPSLRKLSAFSAAIGTCLALAASPAQADLIFAPAIQVQGSGLGAVNTLVTAQESSPTGIQSGCVSSTGGASFNFACLNGLQVPGDNQAINGTRLLSTVSSTTATIPRRIRS